MPTRMMPAVGSSHSPRWAFMQRLDIPDAADPSRVYLRRLRVLQTPWFGLLWHRLLLPDSDRAPHDHPWPFASFVVSGKYSERLYARPEAALEEWVDREWRRFSFHTIDTHVAHRITEVSPGTVTLVLTGRRAREWGFWTRKGFVAWRAYARRPSLRS
jgi:hypothetical protein